MSITDELREYATVSWEPWAEARERLLAMCDRIDAERERVRAESILDMTDESMGEHGWVRLPLDADGKYIHIGDVMEWCNGSFTVHELKLTEDGWQTWDSEHGYTVHADECILHHAPTVEDVLTEFGIDWEHESDCEDRAALLKEYASKLQLREDA